MNLFKVVITAVLATLATLAFGVASIWAIWPSAAEASAGIAQHAGGWHGHAGDHCSHFSNDHVRIGEAVISAGLDLDDAQEASLRVIATRVETLSDDLRATCENTDLTSLDGSLLGVETALALSAAAMGDIRPLVTDFYAGLSEEQRATLHEHMQRHGRHGRHGRRGWHGSAHDGGTQDAG